MVENTNKKDLKNVTIFSVDCVNPHIALEALLETNSKINFGSIKIFSDIKPFNLPNNVEFIKIPRICDLIEYSQFMLKELPKYIETDFCLSIHADGYIHNPHLWNDDFLKYDYIGGPWKSTEYFITSRENRVGNGGVSLRSKRLMDEVDRILPERINGHEDVYIAVALRNYLISKNFKFAPLELASVFSMEIPCDDIPINPENECMAFHGKKYSDFHILKNKEIMIKYLKNTNNMQSIEHLFLQKRNTPSDINEHMDVLYEYAKKCETIAEFGVRRVVSSYAFAHARPKELLCLDIDYNQDVANFMEICKNENINMTFVKDSSLTYELKHDYDLLFIDTLHDFNQLTGELKKHNSKIKKYIIFHDTIYWGNKNEDPITGEAKLETGENVGLVPAIKSFLKENKEWKEVCTYTNNNGLTILERVS
jgi:hypothetical protein